MQTVIKHTGTEYNSTRTKVEQTAWEAPITVVEGAVEELRKRVGNEEAASSL